MAQTQKAAAEAEEAGAGDDVGGLGAGEEVDVEVGGGGVVDGAGVEQGQDVGGGIGEAHQGRAGDGVAGAHEVLAERHADVDGAVADGVDAAEQLARELRRRGRPAPVHLFVCGARAPQLPDPAPIHQLPDAELLDQLRRPGGIPAAALCNTARDALIASLARRVGTITRPS